jgi:hypothetical protein
MPFVMFSLFEFSVTNFTFSQDHGDLEIYARSCEVVVLRREKMAAGEGIGRRCGGDAMRGSVELSNYQLIDEIMALCKCPVHEMMHSGLFASYLQWKE